MITVSSGQREKIILAEPDKGFKIQGENFTRADIQSVEMIGYEECQYCKCYVDLKIIKDHIKKCPENMKALFGDIYRNQSKKEYWAVVMNKQEKACLINDLEFDYLRECKLRDNVYRDRSAKISQDLVPNFNETVKIV